MDSRTVIFLIAGAVAVSSLDLTSSEDTLSEKWVPTRIILPRGRSVNITLGPETAVYCKLTNPKGRVVFQGHGRCILYLRRVTYEDAGVWIMDVARQEHTRTDTYRITAVVRETGAVAVSSLDLTSTEDTVSEKWVPTRIILPRGRSVNITLGPETAVYCKLTNPKGKVVFHGHGRCILYLRRVTYEDAGVWIMDVARRDNTRTDTYRITAVVRETGAAAASTLDLTSTSVDTLSEQWVPTRIILPRGRSVNITLGPETAVYCKLTNPKGRVVFHGHGRCILYLRRVTNDDAGVWIMDVSRQGHIRTDTYRITAVVRGTRDKPTVSTQVTKEQPEVIVKCSVEVQDEVRSCLFRDPAGRTLVSEPGTAEDRYEYTGAGTTVNKGVTTHECGLRITSPVTSDLGLWRCAIETEQEVYYGFLTVLCPWSMQDSNVAATVVSEPTLTSHQDDVIHLAGDSLGLSCSIQAPIRYCYFRGPDGRTYSVSPATFSEEFEYVGSGLDAGECGIIFNTLYSQDTGHWLGGRWSCHVGLLDETQHEQRANVQVEIHQPIAVNQYTSDRGLVLEAKVALEKPVDYCRYVRIDGFGFTSANLPDNRYISTENRSGGHCGLIIESPSILELHPWSIAALVSGSEEEVLDITDHSIDEPVRASNKNTWIWCTSFIAAAILISAAILLIPVKNRRNTFIRVTSWKDSFGSSLSKKPLSDNEIPTSDSPALSA